MKNKILLIQLLFPEVDRRGHPGVSASNICAVITYLCYHKYVLYGWVSPYVWTTNVTVFAGFGFKRHVFKCVHIIFF